MSRMAELFEGCLDLLLDECMTTPDHKALAEKCLRAVKKAAKEYLRDGRAAAFGSLANGFGVFSSDLDVVVQESVPAGASEDSVVVLKKIRKALTRMGTFTLVASIFQARVPVLKMRFQDALDVDISANNTAALQNTRLLAAYAGLGPQVARLGVAVKLWAREFKQCGAGSGRLSSYALILMAIYFLQVTGPHPLPCLQRNGAWNAPVDDRAEFDSSPFTAGEASGHWQSSLGVAVLLCGFFRFYAEDFRWGTEVISVRLGQRLDSQASEFAELCYHEDYRLHIEDPFDLQRNLRDVLTPRNEEDLQQKLYTAYNSLCDGQHMQVLPPSPFVQVGDVAVVRQVLRVDELEEGYLKSSLGNRVEVLHLGSDDKEESDWIYAIDSTLGQTGWLPRAAVILAPRSAVEASSSEVLDTQKGSPSGAPALEKLELCVGDVVVTWENLADAPAGYLGLRPGSSIEVLALGSESEESEREWLYGLDVEMGKHGWLKKSAVLVSSGPEEAAGT